MVIGFFEFTFMRTQPDLPMKELARLFEDYFYESDRFAASHFHGKTQLFRSFVREEALPADDATEILDWSGSHTLSPRRQRCPWGSTSVTIRRSIWSRPATDRKKRA